MAFDDIYKTTWASTVLSSLWETSQYRQAFRDASAFGAVVAGNTINVPAATAVNTGVYDPEADAPLRDLAQRGGATKVPLTIDHLRAYSIDVDDVDELFANMTLLGMLADEANGQLDEDLDLFLMRKLVDGGTLMGSATAASPEALTAEEIDAKLAQAKVEMNNRRAPRANRLAYLPGWAVAKLLTLDKYVSFATPISNERLEEGEVLRAYGFKVIEIAETLSPTVIDDEDDEVIADAFVFTVPNRNMLAMGLDKTAIIDLEAAAIRFGYSIAGLHVAGAKVLYAPHTLVYAVSEQA